MGWLCATACRFGLLTPEAAASGVLAMAGHDLQHDGSMAAPGVLEARSADLTVALAANAGLDAASLATIRRVILAMTRSGPRRNKRTTTCSASSPRKPTYSAASRQTLAGGSSSPWRRKNTPPGGTPTPRLKASPGG
jgi:hypothetical protein